jgi:pilus assembly protein Flp/PilA
MTNIIKRFKNEDGATAIEYGLLAALIAVAIIVVVSAVGQQLGNTFSNVNDELANAHAVQVQPNN